MLKVLPAKAVQIVDRTWRGMSCYCLEKVELVQVSVILAMVVAKFNVTLAERMGGYQGILERQTNAFTLSLKDGCWLKFAARLKDDHSHESRE